MSQNFHSGDKLYASDMGEDPYSFTPSGFHVKNAKSSNSCADARTVVLCKEFVSPMFPCPCTYSRERYFITKMLKNCVKCLTSRTISVCVSYLIFLHSCICTSITKSTDKHHVHLLNTSVGVWYFWHTFIFSFKSYGSFNVFPSTF